MMSIKKIQVDVEEFYNWAKNNMCFNESKLMVLMYGKNQEIKHICGIIERRLKVWWDVNTVIVCAVETGMVNMLKLFKWLFVGEKKNSREQSLCVLQ